MTSPTLEPIPVESDANLGRWMVVIHNNDTNSMDEVLFILMVATGCDEQEAFCEMWEAHTFGKAPVHFAEQGECERVAKVIETIGIRTSVTREWA